MYKIKNKFILSNIFKLKGNFRNGGFPESKKFENVYIAPFKDNKSAAVTISADFELGWAWRSRGIEFTTKKAKTARSNFPLLLSLLEKYQIPITWATVGHLFLSECSKNSDDVAHPDMPRPPINHLTPGDWYEFDPCTNMDADPSWYSPDLINQILQSPIKHEIGTHTFSHIDFSPRLSSENLVQKEIEKCINVMKPFGITPKSLVFPFNHNGDTYLELLSNMGINAVRYRDNKVRISYPERTPTGIYKLYESMNLRAASHYDYIDKVEIFINQAIKNNAAYNLWFHPSDHREIFENEFQRILSLLASGSVKKQVWTTTISELISYCEARDSMNLKIENIHNCINIDLISSFNKDRYGNSDLTLLVVCKDEPKVIKFKNDTILNQISNLEDHHYHFDKFNKKLIITIPISIKRLEIYF